MYAVIFRSIRTDHSEDLYKQHSDQMESLVKEIPGYISHFSHRDPSTDIGVTVSYFESKEAIKLWREHPQHQTTQALGRSHFYSWYQIQIVKVEDDREWHK